MMDAISIETEIPQGKLILSRTDLQGKITYANETFAHICGYQVDELLNQPHNIIRHPDMPRSIFKHMWDTIASGKEWTGEIKNLRKDGGYYWVHATVSPLSENGKVTGYKSSRTYISPNKRQEMDKKYTIIRNAEGGQIAFTMHLSSSQWNKLKEVSENQGLTYQEVITQLINKL